MSYVRSFNNSHGIKGSSRIESEEAHIAFGILILEILALGAGGGLLYLLSAGSKEAEKQPKAQDF
jgi:hypothetical protein